MIPITPSDTWQLVTMDIAGPLPEKKSKRKYILALCDHFTKYTVLYTMADMTAETVANKIVEFSMIFGLPESILSDQGAQFQSQLLESLWEALDIHQLRTSPFHPQTDGLTERINRTVKEMLTHFVNEAQSDWDEKLHKLAFAYNTSVHSTTEFSPYELLFGRKAKVSLDLVYGETERPYQVNWNIQNL